jgi:CHAT domain-containing protein
VAGHLAELRAVVAEIENCGFDGRRATGLVRRQSELEELIRRRTWHADAGEGDPARPPSPGRLGDALGDRALVELVEHGDDLMAVTVVDGRARLHRLGERTAIAAEVDNLRFAVGRLARPRGSSTARAAAEAARRFAAERLDELVLAPLARTTGDRSLVVVPTGPLHALPWATLPSCRGRSVAVAPSAALWLRATTSATQADDGDTVLVAGPGVTAASAEVAELAAAYPDARVLDGPAATAANVTGALEGARLVHVACHGTFRADNPLFSSLRLAGGPLTVYDLESLRHAPARLVLSACDVGLSAVRPGDELMGLSSAVLSLGSTTLVASVVPVPDDAGRVLMVDFHRRMLAGGSPADALAGALDAGDAPEGFVCFGA